MSDLSINNDAWLSKLRSHLDADSCTIASLGLARTTAVCRRNEACCFLVWLGERETTREELSRLTLHDVDAYMKHRASSLRRIRSKL